MCNYLTRLKIIEDPASSSYTKEKRNHIQEHIYHPAATAA